MKASLKNKYTRGDFYKYTIKNASIAILSISVLQDLDVEGDGMQGPPSPLQFDTALALEDQTIRAIAEAPMDILTGEDPDQDLDTSGQELSERDVDAIMNNQVNSQSGVLSS